MNEELFEKFVEVNSDGSLVKIYGYLGFPEAAQRNRNSFYLYINNRFIQSSTKSGPQLKLVNTNAKRTPRSIPNKICQCSANFFIVCLIIF